MALSLPAKDPTPMQFMDHALAKRIESVMSAQNALFARRGAEVNPAGTFRSAPMLGGQAVFASLEAAPVNKVTGGGLAGPVSPEEFDRFEAFYREHHAPPKLEVNPHADPSLMKLVRERGYTVEFFMSTHVRFLGAPWDEPVPAPAIRVEAVTAATIVEYADTVVAGFQEGGPMITAFRDMNRGPLRHPGALPLIARIGGRAAGAAFTCACEHESGRVGVLFGASTLPEFRRRGVQTALLSRRLGHARENGCEIAVIQARPGTSSERNMARFGFRLAYNKAVMLKE